MVLKAYSMLAIGLLLSVVHAIAATDSAPAVTVSVNFQGQGVRRFQTTATFQVVSNPLLEKTFALEDGSSIQNPIHQAAWDSVKQLQADHIRFQLWFPYPHTSVAELDPPKPGHPTSWNFTSLLPQLGDFMDSTSGHPVIWNFGTIPCWMFWGPTTGGCPYPKDPRVSDFGYGERGIRAFFRDRSGVTLAEYFSRLFGFLIRGSMVDENGAVHAGGPAYNLSAARGDVIEFLNEGEHYYTPKEYINDYDVAVSHLQRDLPKDRIPSFMGIGGCHNGHWNWWYMGSCTQWLTEFLNHSHHVDSDVPLPYASIHYYASSSNRSDTSTYTRDFFGSADKWLKEMDTNIAIRDKLSPQTKLAITELGVLLLDDESKVFGPDGGLPDIFFNAVGSFFAYVFAQLSLKGVDIACFSQLIGSPPIPEWGIKDMQFPSGTMISWETGNGNAKYWTLSLILQHLNKGDFMYEVGVSQITQSLKPARTHMCEAIGPWTFNNEVTFTCNDPNARIDRIWADAGMEPTGECGDYRPNKVCSNHLITTARAALACLGRRSCTLQRGDYIEQLLTCPSQTFRKDSQLFSLRLTVQASCTGSAGGHTSAEYHGNSVFSLGFAPSRANDGAKKLLLVNKEIHPITVKLNATDFMAGATAYIVDPFSVTRSSKQGIREEKWRVDPTTGEGDVVTLQPYAVVIAVMNTSVPAKPSIVI